MMGEAFNSFTGEERRDLAAFGHMAEKNGFPLSGYLAGRPRGGEYVVALENEWSETFRVKHSIAVNSATSGLLAAAFAADLKHLDTFICPAMTMSATAAAPCFTGATPIFGDIDPDDFGLDVTIPTPSTCKAIFVTNLFGHPARLNMWREIAVTNDAILIEDNAQSPFATEYGQYAGTVGHIGVFSLNIHKPLQCGEGGMIVTDDDDLADRMRAFINHGEHANGRIGLNLRMPEICAVVALTQLQRAPSIIGQRIEQAEAIIDAIGFIPGLRPPITRANCKHVYYTVPFLIDRSRNAFCNALSAEGVPVVERYAAPLYTMPAFQLPALRADMMNCPVTDDLWTKRMLYIENCAWTFTKRQIKQIGDAFHKAAEAVKL